MDLSKLSPAEKVIMGSGFALIIISLMPWFELPVIRARVNGWDNLLSAVAVLIGMAMMLQILLSRFSSARLPKPPIPWGMLHLLLGAVVVVLVLIQLFAGDTITVRGEGLVTVSVDLERRIGVFLAVLAAAGLMYGGFLKSKEPESASPGYLG